MSNRLLLSYYGTNVSNRLTESYWSVRLLLELQTNVSNRLLLRVTIGTIVDYY